MFFSNLNCHLPLNKNKVILCNHVKCTGANPFSFSCLTYNLNQFRKSNESKKVYNDFLTNIIFDFCIYLFIYLHIYLVRYVSME